MVKKVILETPIAGNKQSIIRSVVFIAALVVIIAGLKASTNLILPFLMSVFITIMCNPLVKRADDYNIPKVISVCTVIFLFVILVMILAGVVGSSLNELSRLLPGYKEQLDDKFEWLVAKLNEFNIQLSSDLVLEYFNPSAAMDLATNMFSSLSGAMANLFLIILTVVFMLFEASGLPRKLHLALDDPEMRLNQIERFVSSVNSYIAIKAAVSVVTGVLVSLMLWAFGLDFYLLWGVLAFLLNFIPNIGSILAAIPAVLLALVQLNPVTAGFIGLGYLIINLVMGNIVEPRYLGKGLGLSTLVVFLSLIFWGWLFGTVGMLLSVPLTMIIKIGLENSEEGRWFADLLSSDDE
ncbi:AI-2E family transporter [Thalassotalea sp. LPB0316]|uniref:AI-2E family transporter n=1 Tax=Thalassotalea sp. LPB0316 TaxID=2769490 RepID=UPI001865B391|nr:AI-2E family transporter [Thalassotalea sp. LPB0316]QOL24765.1 AI-2E family transporter [Thalassotalea sp. LPB0316]